MSKLILVVEDQEDNRQIIRDMLAATDYEITEAENGEHALTAVAKQRPAPNKGRSHPEIDSDHCCHVLRAERRRTEGACGWLR